MIGLTSPPKEISPAALIKILVLRFNFNPDVEATVFKVVRSQEEFDKED